VTFVPNQTRYTSAVELFDQRILRSQRNRGNRPCFSSVCQIAEVEPKAPILPKKRRS
jgi:hypothetical protein